MRKIKSLKKKNGIGLHPVMTFLLLIMGVIVLSGLLGLLNTQATYNAYSSLTESYVPTTEAVKSLFNLSGLKYIFTNTVSNFANFTVLSNLIIILIGIGIMEKSGFLKTVVMLFTKRLKKKTVTFWIVLLCIISSIVGDLPFIVLIPLSALIFLHGKRNPLIGIVVSFAALTIGSSFSILLTSVDSSLMSLTMLNAGVISLNYSMSTFSFVLTNFLIIIVLAFAIMKITEDYVVRKLPKYEFEESSVEEEIINKKQLKGLLFASSVAIIYLLIVIYNIIPGLPFSGNLLDYTQTLYIDKLFSHESFFSNGFVFIITLLFVLMGLFYGIGAKTIKNNKDVAENLGYSLNGIGKVLVLIFIASTFISIFKQTNIGATLVAGFTNIIEKSNFTGFSLVLLLYIFSVISTIFIPSSITKWTIMVNSIVPTFMNSGMSPAFAQVVFRIGEAVTMGLTPMLAYFVIYLAYIEQYNQSDKPIKIRDVIKWQLPYALLMFILGLVVITLCYLFNMPLGVGAYVSL